MIDHSIRNESSKTYELTQEDDEIIKGDLSACTSVVAYVWLKKTIITSKLVEATQRVLDVGCGWGREIRLFIDSVGIDIDLSRLKTAKQLSSNDLIQASAEYLPFRPQVFHCVLMSEVIEHLHQPEHAIIEVKRVLQVHGQLLIQTPNRRVTAIRPVHPDYGHINEFSKQELVALLHTHQFTIHEITGSTIPFMPSDSAYYHLNYRWLWFSFWKFLNAVLPFTWDIIISAESRTR